MLPTTRPRADIVHLTTVHPRDDARIFVKEACTLAGRTRASVVLMVADGQGDAAHERDGALVRVRDIGVPSGGRVRRALSAAWRAFREVRRLSPRVVHFHDPELIPAALLLKACGHAVVYDVHEDLPRQVLTKHWIPVLVRRPLAWAMAALEWGAGRVFDAIAAATPTIAARFPANKTALVQNFPLLSELVPAQSTPYRGRERHFAYIGVISPLRGAREMVGAAGALAQGTLRLAGQFVPAGLHGELARSPGWRACRFDGYLSRAGVAQLLGEVRGGLVVLHPTANYPDSYPVKMFEYMAAGLPVIASDFPLWRSIVDEARCGVLVDPLDERAIAAAMTRMLEDDGAAEAMGQRGRAAVERKYNWDREAVKLLAVYERLLPAILGTRSSTADLVAPPGRS